MSDWIGTYKKLRNELVKKLLIYLLAAGVSFALVWHPDWVLPFIPPVIIGSIMGVTAGFAFIKIVELSLLLMSKGRYAYLFGNGLAFFERKDMRMCEEMALQGYSLVNVNGSGFYKFERTAPQEMIYAVDYSDVKKNSKQFDEYLEIFKAGGWEHVCGDRLMFFFRAPKGTTPIYTDNENLAHKYERMRRYSVWSVITGVLLAAMAYAVLNYINPTSTILLVTLAIVGAMSFGFAIAMSFGIVLNHLRVVKLRKPQPRV